MKMPPVVGYGYFLESPNRKKNEYAAYQASVKSPLLEGARVARKPVNVFGDKFLLVLRNKYSCC